MSPFEDFLLRLLGAVLFITLVASAVIVRRLADRDVRQALSALPRQGRGGEL
ncbi:hypothetical protein [Streptomyces sp. OE57]|uniref:hypothetical protein n=1 Tax=Streptomyces lacaronensis TaxID=3379885 RepID=UPI0039B76788